MSVLGVIPARLHSTRLPGKVLMPIAGKPMVQHVYERACRASIDGLLVATDSREVWDFCWKVGIPVEMTLATHQSGTDRIWEISNRHHADWYLNVQGDQPLVTVERIEAVLQAAPMGAEVKTLRYQLPAEDLANPHAVKVVSNARGEALYFSRLGVPFSRDGDQVTRYGHLGIYAYTRSALEQFHYASPSPLELAERLEQLRFLDIGVRIHVFDAPGPTIGVDTAADLAEVEHILADQ